MPEAPPASWPIPTLESAGRRELAALLQWSGYVGAQELVEAGSPRRWMI
jgi:hypothetical protein